MAIAIVSFTIAQYGTDFLLKTIKMKDRSSFCFILTIVCVWMYFSF